jgi:hypothetical protein
LAPPPAGPNREKVLVPVLSLCRRAEEGRGGQARAGRVRLTSLAIAAAVAADSSAGARQGCPDYLHTSIATQHSQQLHKPAASGQQRPASLGLLALRKWKRFVARLELAAWGSIRLACRSTWQGMPAGQMMVRAQQQQQSVGRQAERHMHPLLKM